MSDDQSPSNGTLVFYLQPGKLVDLAAVSLLGALKHHKITQLHRGNNEININTSEIDLIGGELPKPITNKLRKFPDRMDKCIAKWWKYHWEQVFFRSMPSNDMITLFDQLVWLHDGVDSSISFEQTARKLIDCGILTNVQKFQIACTYCFIDDVNLLKKTMSPDEIRLATGSFCTDVDPFLEYWCCKIRLMTGFSFLTNTNINFLSELIQPDCRKYYHHWPVVEYFWNQVCNEEERLRTAERIIYISSRSTAELMWHLLPKLTSSQLDSVIREAGCEITLHLANEYNYVEYEYAMLAWKRVVNLIDDYDLNCLLRLVTDMEKNRDYVDGLLREMWLYMSKQQKKYIANQQEFNYVAKWIDEYEYNSPNYQLIVDIYSLWDFERRRQYWKANWTNLVIGQMNYVNKVEEIMRIFLGSDENIAIFKRTVMIDYNAIGTVCENLLSWGDFEELQHYWNFCTIDQDVIRNLKKQIIESMPKDTMFHVLCDCCEDESLHAEFENFLRDIFTADEIKDFPKNVLLASLERMEEMLRDGSVHLLMQCVEKYLSTEKDLCTIKLHLIKYSREHHEIAMNIELADWMDFSSWLYEGNSSFTKRLKTLLQPDEAEVFDDVEMEEPSLYDYFCKKI
ncbi:uncharacterized protein LOC135845410 isoform X1 [Planococcus citri]|uniref:uncharacterized protein LOC135845410 isoform X1 n=1 Tax=Planococcus citri TaxID=170843 RepID=UPI0031F85A86